MDRLKEYFTNKLDDFLFVDLTEEITETNTALMSLAGVPVPIKREDLTGFAGGGGLDLTALGERMAFVIGCDTEFKFKDPYLDFLGRAFDENLIRVMIARATKKADAGNFYDACIDFRSALAVNENDPAAMMGYARACQDIYATSEDDEEIGNFKAESLEYFEKMTIEHPDIPAGHYYLGYAYVNMGLYLKARIVWEDFLKLNDIDPEEIYSGKLKIIPPRQNPDGEAMQDVMETIREIADRLMQLREPVVIEEGCNHIISGRYEAGINILENYRDGEYGKWWPLHYYLGTAYRELGELTDAVECFKQVLRLNATHADSMQELAEIYEEFGDDENAKKYRKKIELVI